MAHYKNYPFIMKIIVKKYLKENCIENKKEILNKTYKNYKDFVLEAPDIGGRKNTMSNNLYYALAFFSFYEATKRNFTKEEFYEFLEKNMPSHIPVLSSIINMNHKSIQNILAKHLKKYKEKSEKNNWGNTWKMEINPHNRKTGVAIDLVSCPIVDFAMKHNYMEIMPVLCKMDYLTAKLMHGKLIRENTIAENGKYCDYWYMGDNNDEKYYE